MVNGKIESLDKAELRRQAEERMKASGDAAMGASDPGVNTQRLIQELQIHQIELEMQNDELKRVLDEAEAQKERYLDLYDFAPVGYVTLNSGGTILRVNLAGADILGVERSRLIGQPFRYYISGDSYLAFNAFFERTLESGTTESCEVMLLNGRGEPRFVQFGARLCGSKKSCRLVMIDITDRKRGEEALERARQLENINKELDSFSYSVSHDLRAPLRAIDGYTRMILKKEGDRFEADTRDKFQVIRSNVQKMNQLIDDLLDFSRLAKSDLSVAKLDMEGLFLDAWQELQRANPDRGMTLKIDKLPQCMGDRNLMIQVCVNILSNAVKFTKVRDNALIEAGGYLERNECVYFVKDNGVGFDMSYHDKLFGVFQRLHGDKGYEGTGIGLALVKRIINRHRGRVWAEGSVDKGATFYFTLPTEQA